MDKKNKSTNKNFGLVFFILFMIVSFYPLLNQGKIHLWSIVLSFTFLFLGLMNSILLTPLNGLWYRIGLLLGKFIAPIIMGIVYFAVVFPTFLILSIVKKNYLNINYERNKNTYWIDVHNEKTSMKDQF
jgi:hypothetical protein